MQKLFSGQLSLENILKLIKLEKKVGFANESLVKNSKISFKVEIEA